MGAELGRPPRSFPLTTRWWEYLTITERKEIADLAEANESMLGPTLKCMRRPEKYFDEILEIDLSTLEPHVVGRIPRIWRDRFRARGRGQGKRVSRGLKATLLGSCTNSSYEDISRAAHIARQGLKAGLKAKTAFLVSPGSGTDFSHHEA